jgi:bifunctional enzyme CysN/CysC
MPSLTAERDELSMVVVGHVDHGKSTIIGRLLAETDSLPQGKLEAIREKCRRTSRPFEYAFLLDALKEEQAQGITIDVARCFFKTARRNYTIIDAPGHIEFLKNMVTGASWAEAALLVIDAEEGVRENSRRHGYLLAMLGIRQMAVLVNKMDLIRYDETIYRRVVDEYTGFLSQIGVTSVSYIPVSGRQGDNLTSHSANMPWYTGPSLIEQIEAFVPKLPADEKPLRFPVQDVYKFTRGDDNRRIIAGKIETGKLAVGDEVIFYPSGKHSTVQTIEAFNVKFPLLQHTAGWSVGFTLTEQTYVKRGEIAALASQVGPQTAVRLKTNLFWLGRNPLEINKRYQFKLNTAKAEVEVEAILRILDASTLIQKEGAQVQRHEVAECILKLDRPIACDLSVDFPETGRFVIVDSYEISGGGIITGIMPDPKEKLSNRVQRRNIHWEIASINEEERAERYNQRSCLVVVTGSKTDGLRKGVAKALEKRLFLDGKFVYFIGMANLIYGIDADIKNGANDPDDADDIEVEYFRRLAEVANLMLNAGLILVVSARDFRKEDLAILETVLAERLGRIYTVWAGDTITTNLVPTLHLNTEECQHADQSIKTFLQDEGVLFRP